MAKSKVVGNTAALVVLVVLLAAMAANAESVLLRHRFVPGQELVYDLWASGAASDLFITRMGTNTQYRVPVESVDEQGNATLGLRMGPIGTQTEVLGYKIHGTMDPATGTYELEVDGEATQLLTQSKQILANWFGLWQGVTARVSPRGKVLSISGLPELPASSMAQMPTLGNFFANLEEMPAWLPEEPVSVGDSWAVQVPLPLLEMAPLMPQVLLPPPGMAPAMPEELSVDYTVECLGEINHQRVARLGFEAVVEGIDMDLGMLADPGGQAPPDAIEEMHLSLDGAIDGKLYFDLDRGQVHSARGDILVSVVPAEQVEEAGGNFEVQTRMHFVLSLAK